MSLDFVCDEEARLCPICCDGLLSTNIDYPDLVVYTCSKCHANFTPAILDEILKKQHRLIAIEAERAYHKYRIRIVLIVTIFLLFFVFLTILAL